MTPSVRFIAVTLAALATALVTARLGFWQLSRAAEKQTLQDAIDARQQQAPLRGATQLPDDDAQAAALLLHRRVELRGRWLQQHTVFLDNRQMNGRPGFYVVTPLQLPDGRALLVQRGWVARDPGDRARVHAPALPEGDASVVGRIAPAPARLLEFKGTDAGRIRQNLDPDAFARETGMRLLRLSLLQTAPVHASDTLQREWGAPASGVAKHHGYAFQWFALSALVAGLYVWFQFLQPRRSRRH